MGRKSKLREKIAAVAKKMPPAYHKIPGEDLDVMKSQACDWLCSQPEIRMIVFDVAKSSGAIEYQEGNGSWYGEEWSEEHAG